MIVAAALLACLWLAPDELSDLLARLRHDNPAEAAKVEALAAQDPTSALRFLRERYGAGDPAPKGKTPAPAPGGKPPVPAASAVLPARRERFTRLATVGVGEFEVDLCRREDGAFGLGTIRLRGRAIRRDDFLVTWAIAGRVPAFAGRDGPTITLREPDARLTLAHEALASAGTTFATLVLRFEAKTGPIVETASWEPGGTTRGATYFDGYRGWHAPPAFVAADAVPETNPKLRPSLLHGTGFQFIHGPGGGLATFHACPGDRLVNASRGEALEHVTTFEGPTTIERRVCIALAAGSRIDLWTRALEVAQSTIGAALGVPARAREAICWWPTFARSGFRQVAAACAEATVADGFTAVLLDNVFDNVEFHGGGKNLNTWGYDVCEGYGGDAGLAVLVAACRARRLAVHAWIPTGHLSADAPMWQAHPDWLLRDARGEPWKSPSGGVAGDCASGFGAHFVERVGGLVRRHGLAGCWFDTHLPWAGHRAAAVAEAYQDIQRAGARDLWVEGDASSLAGYATLTPDGDGWVLPEDPDLFHGASLVGIPDARTALARFRRYAASGVWLVVPWDLMHSPKVTGPEVETARAEIRAVVREYVAHRDLMVHRFVHPDGSGYTWTNDRDTRRCVWLLQDAPLPDGRAGRAGGVYVVP